jgi:hypothetical protein
LRKISTYTPPPWQLRAVQEIILFPEGPLLVIDQPVRGFVHAGLLERLREEHRKRGGLIGELVEEALRLYLDPPVPGADLPPLPVLPPAHPRVDLSDRKALERESDPPE